MNSFGLLIGCFIGCCLLASTSLHAQNALETNANTYYQSPENSNERLLAAGKYAQALFFNGQQIEAMQLLDENIQKARKKKDGQYAAYLNSIAALNSRILNDHAKAHGYLDQAKLYAGKTADPATKAYVLYGEGWLQVRNEEEAAAIKSFQQALTYLDKVSNQRTIISRKTAIYKELSSIYSNWKEYELQEKYTKLTLEVALKQNNPMDIFDALMLMGYLYEQQYRNHPKEEKLLNQAEHYYLQAISTYQTHENKMANPTDLAFVAINLANLYLQFYPDSYLDSTQSYAKLALKVSEKAQQYTQIASAYGIMADCSLRENDQTSAREHLLASLAALLKESVVDHTVSLSLFLKLAEVYDAENNPREALHYYKEYVKVYEKVYDTEKMEQGRRLEAQFEKERQKQELIRLQLEAEKKEQQISLMHALNGQQVQQLENMKLNQKNQRQQMEVIKLEADKRGQELKLSRIETQQRINELNISQQQVAYKSKINIIYTLLTVTLAISALLVYYAYRQRSKTLKQKESLHLFEVNEMTQRNKISTLTAMLEGQETERARLARDLHDGLGGLLSGTKMGLSDVARKIGASTLQYEVNNTLSQLDMAVDELRRIAHNLMPELLLKYGLKETIKEYANRMSNDQLDVSSQFVNYNNRLDSQQQIITYRIIQELVNNAVKHARARQIFIQLSENDGQIFVTVEDDGVGFDKGKLGGKQSAGMHNVQSRLDFLRGQMHIDSTPGIGTTIEFNFPLHILNETV